MTQNRSATGLGLLSPVSAPAPPSRTYYVASFLFPRVIGAIYLVAFTSLGMQITGLVGRQGILPAAEYLPALHARFGALAYYLAPSLVWLNTGDGFLRFLCFGGALLAILVVLGVAQAPLLAVLWCFDLSLFHVGQDFLGFQWDILLLETGFLAIFLASWSLRPRPYLEARPSNAVLWLLRLLLFRLMLQSGLVKLLSADPTWRSLTALRYHYETQPLPTWIGWLMHQLPGWFQMLSVLVMFTVELVVPFFVFGPPRLRRVAAAAFLVLQVLILLTGNYTFFNWLAIALCLPLVDDALWPDRLYRRVVRLRPDAPSWPRWIIAPVAGLLLFLNLSFVEFVAPTLVPMPVARLIALWQPLHLVNGYGLFAVMTTQRDEILVEGSLDGTSWRPYNFKFKPGDLRRRPGFVAPHQPRLDWQMWFAALGRCEDSPWFARFLVRLLEGSPDVTALLAANPFPDAPPRYVRAMRTTYHFTDWSTLRATGNWWRREPKGLFCPVLKR